jgi:DNA-directed RNA polymerase specialized sigma24 family protein
VSNLPLPKRDWEMTPSAFGKLLACLHSEPERAGEEYERIRQKLIIYFEGRRCSPSDEYADEVINRVARRLDEGEEIRELGRYVFGVARLLRLEIVRQPQNDGEDEEFLNRLVALPGPEIEIEGDDRMQFLERCLEELPLKSKEMILEYYQGEKHEKIQRRRELGLRLGLSANALSIRACRIRTKVEQCVKDCCKSG